MKTAMISSVLLILLGATGSGVSAQPGGPARERFVLTGMVVWSDKEGVAWLQEPEFTRNEIVTVRIGESVGPWKLTQFLENGVELDGPAGKVLVPLGAPGSAVAAGAPANTATASPARPVPAPAGPVPANDAVRAAAPAAPVSPDPGYVWESNRPVPNAGAFGEALNQARAARTQRQAGNAPEQPRQAGTAAGQAARGASTAPGAAPSDGASGAGSSGTNQVIQFPVGGGKQGIRELFGNR